MIHLRRWRWRRGALVLGVLALLLLLPVGYHLFRQHDRRERLRATLAELDRTAPGWRMHDIQKQRVAPPPGQNGAEIIESALRIGPTGGVGVQLDDWRLLPNQTLTPRQATRLRAELSKFANRLQEARTLRRYPDGQFAVTIAPDFISTLLPHVQHVRETGHLLLMDAVWQAQQGNFDLAAEDLHAAVNAGNTLRAEPFLISQLVRLAMLRSACTTLERVLAQGQMRGETLERLQRLLEQQDAAEAWYEAIAGERAGLHETFKHLAHNQLQVSYLRSLTNGNGRTGWLARLSDLNAGMTVTSSHEFLLHHLTAIMETQRLPLAERHAQLDKIFSEVAAAPELASVLLSPSWRRTADAFAREEAQLRSAEAGLAAERFRQQQGRWPKNLAELTPPFLSKTPLDPYDGAPLRFRTTKDGIVIYSVGPEHTFDGTSRDAGVPAENGPQTLYEFRLWNVDQRRRPGKD